MAGVISGEDYTNKHYKFAGFTTTITASHSSVHAGVRGVSWGDASCPHELSASFVGALDKHFKHAGFSGSITDSYVAPDDGSFGIAWDGSNVISAGNYADKHFKHTGFSSTISNSYSSPGTYPAGIDWDSSNVLSSDLVVTKHYKHAGFSSTVTDSYTSPGFDPTGIGWDGSNVLCCDWDSRKNYKHAGFSSTVTDSYTVPGLLPLPVGMSWSAVPVNPSNVTAHYQATDQAYATWTDNADDEEYYDVQYRLDGGGWQNDPNTPYGADTEQSTAFGVGADHKVEFQVRAGNTAQGGGPSEWVVSTATYTTPDAPSGCAGSRIYNTQIDIGWTDNSAYEQGFRIERKVDDGSWVFLINKDAEVEAHSDTTTSAGHKYEYRVRAYRTSPDTLNSGWATSAPVYTTILYAAWVDNNRVYCARSDDDGYSWGTPVIVDDGASSITRSSPKIQADSDNDIYVVWYRKNDSTGLTGIAINHSADGGSTWSGAHDIDAQAKDALITEYLGFIIDSADYLWVFFGQQTWKKGVWYYKSTNIKDYDTWDNDVYITLSIEPTSQIEVCEDPNGWLWIAYVDAFTPCVARCHRHNGSRWIREADIGTGGVPCTLSDLSITAGPNHVYVAYYDDDAEKSYIRRKHNGGWQAAVEIAAGQWPSIGGCCLWAMTVGTTASMEVNQRDSEDAGQTWGGATERSHGEGDSENITGHKAVDCMHMPYSIFVTTSHKLFVCKGAATE